MTISATARRLLDNKKEILTENQRDVVEDTINDLLYNCRVYAIPNAKDDRLAELEAAIIAYLITSEFM